MYRSRKTQLSYSTLVTGKGCAFCKLDDVALNPQPRTIVCKTAHMYVTTNLFPYDYWDKLRVDEHLLLFPVRHISTMDELNKVERKEFMNLLCEYESKGYSIYSRAPINTSRSVMHIHTHLIKTSGREQRILLSVRRPYIRLYW